MDVNEFLRDEDYDSDEFIMDREEAKEFMEECRRNGGEMPKVEESSEEDTASEDEDEGDGHELDWEVDSYDSDAEPSYYGQPTLHKPVVTALEFLIETSTHPPEAWRQKLITAMNFLVETSYHAPRKLLKRLSAPSIIEYTTNKTKEEDEGATGFSKPKLLKQQSAPLLKISTLPNLTEIGSEVAFTEDVPVAVEQETEV